MSGVWVGLGTNNGELRSVAFEMLTAARRLADASGAQVSALVWGEGAQDSAKALGECGSDNVVVVELSSDASARPAEVSAALAQLAAEQNPSVLLLADGAFSRSVAPALAQKLSLLSSPMSSMWHSTESRSYAPAVFRQGHRTRRTYRCFRAHHRFHPSEGLRGRAARRGPHRRRQHVRGFSRCGRTCAARRRARGFRARRSV